MVINEVSGAQQTQPTRRVEIKKDQAGNPVNCIFEDRNGDGKLDLYQIKKVGIAWDGCTHELTYTDRDGDGYFDTVSEKITSNMRNKEGRLSEDDKLILNEYSEKSEATKMDNILNPPKQKMRILPNLSWKF